MDAFSQNLAEALWQENSCERGGYVVFFSSTVETLLSGC